MASMELMRGSAPGPVAHEQEMKVYRLGYPPRP